MFLSWVIRIRIKQLGDPNPHCDPMGQDDFMIKFKKLQNYF